MLADVCLLLARWVLAAMPGLLVTSIMLSMNYNAKRHRAKQNEGSCIARVWSDFTDGELLDWHKDGLKMDLSKLAVHKSEHSLMATKTAKGTREWGSSKYSRGVRRDLHGPWHGADEGCREL